MSAPDDPFAGAGVSAASFNAGFGQDLGGVAGALSGLTGGISAARSLIGGVLGLAGAYGGQLQPASWRGQRFVVLGSTVRAGRRKALHEYPFRDGVWVEDLGQRGRLYGFDGFLASDDVGSLLKTMLANVEQAGPGELVHPTLGAVQCEVVDFEAGDRWDEGGVWRIRLEFLHPQPGTLQLLPAAGDSTQDQVTSAATDAEGASSDSFLGSIGSAIQGGTAAVGQAVAAVQPYVATARQLAGDASGLFNAASGIAGSFGRFAGGRGIASDGIQGALRTAGHVQTAVGGALSAASQARAAVEKAGAGLLQLASP